MILGWVINRFLQLSLYIRSLSANTYICRTGNVSERSASKANTYHASLSSDLSDCDVELEERYLAYRPRFYASMNAHPPFARPLKKCWWEEYFDRKWIMRAYCVNDVTITNPLSINNTCAVFLWSYSNN